MRKAVNKASESLSAIRRQPGISLRLRGGLREAMETYGEALSLAEAGEVGIAQDILGEFHAEQRKILVLAEGDGIPEAMVVYTVNLAERLGFDLVLLSVGDPVRSKADFETLACAAGRKLFDEAALRGVSCAHILRQGKRDEVLNAVSVELRRVEFVVTRRPDAERKSSALMVPEFSLKC